MIIWFTGLSGSGKTTLSNLLKKELKKLDYSVCQVDGDIFRKKERRENRFSRKDILDNNYRMISYCQSTQKDYDFIIVSAISPYEETRKKARKIFGKEYVEIFLHCPLGELIKRNVKNLYQKALKGEIKNLIGFSPSVPYEKPKNPHLIVNTSKETIREALRKILELINKNNL